MTQLCPVQLKNMPGLHAVQVHTITHDHTRSHTCNHHGCKLLAYLEKLWHCDASVWCIACVSDVSHVFLMFYDVSGVSGVSVGLTPPKAGGSTVVSRCSVSGCAPGEAWPRCCCTSCPTWTATMARRPRWSCGTAPRTWRGTRTAPKVPGVPGMGTRKTLKDGRKMGESRLKSCWNVNCEMFDPFW